MFVFILIVIGMLVIGALGYGFSFRGIKNKNANISPGREKIAEVFTKQSNM